MRRLAEIFREQIRRPRARAGAALLSGTLVGAGASFVAAVVAARTLALDDFAAFGVGIAVNSLTMQFADLGLGTVAMAEAADAKGRNEARRRLVQLTVRRFGTALLAGALISLVVILVPSLSPYRDVALIAVFGGVIGCLALFTVGALQAYRRFTAAGAVQVALGVTRLTMVVAAASSGLGVTAMMAGYAVVAPIVAVVLGASILALHSRSEMKDAEADELTVAELRLEEEDEATRGRDRSVRRNYIAGMAIFSALLLNGDVLLLTSFGTPADVATYSAAWRFSAGLLLLVTALVGASLPFVLTSVDPWRELGKLLRMGLALCGGLLLLVAPMTFFGVRLLGEAGDSAGGPLAVLLVAFSIDAFFLFTIQIYLRIRREKFLMFVIAGELLSMILITLAFRSQGALAPAIGQLATRLLASVVIMIPVVLERRGRISWFSGQIE